MNKEKLLIGAIKISTGLLMVLISSHWLVNIMGVIISLSGLDDIE